MAESWRHARCVRQTGDTSTARVSPGMVRQSAAPLVTNLARYLATAGPRAGRCEHQPPCRISAAPPLEWPVLQPRACGDTYPPAVNARQPRWLARCHPHRDTATAKPRPHASSPPLRRGKATAACDPVTMAERLARQLQETLKHSCSVVCDE